MLLYFTQGLNVDCWKLTADWLYSGYIPAKTKLLSVYGILHLAPLEQIQKEKLS